ncbi:oxygenase MpaB family protein [Pseudomonas entomophila]|uniref:oxygenase MpaB family protein n=1 Tax=Pseudomonas sp. RIT-PI-S TaxID=3035295 RepID=UPI0021DB397D
MEAFRRRVERQVLGLTGLALGQLDLRSPPGDPGLFGPGSVCWQVHGDFTAMLIGGVRALLLQMLHPLALAGVWEHSNFRDDMLGRLRRTGQFVSGTTYGSTRDANWLIEKVRTIHLQVSGSVDGQPYAASDPALLTWVHVAEMSSFLAAHLRYRDPLLSGQAQDQYYAEVALVAERLGAREVPRSRAEVEQYLQRLRPQLRCDERTHEVARLLRAAPAPSQLARPVGQLMLNAGIGLLPPWAASMLALEQSALQRGVVSLGLGCSTPLLRWAVRDGSQHRARQRMRLGG